MLLVSKGQAILFVLGRHKIKRCDIKFIQSDTHLDGIESDLWRHK